MTPISWSTTARYGMAVSAWRAMIAEHYPGGGWVRVGDDTLARLHALRARARPGYGRRRCCASSWGPADGRGSRAPGLLAALRGIRALSRTRPRRPRTRPRPRSGSSTRRRTPPSARAPTITHGWRRSRSPTRRSPLPPSSRRRCAGSRRAERATGPLERRAVLGPVGIGERTTAEIPGGRLHPALRATRIQPGTHPCPRVRAQHGPRWRPGSTAPVRSPPRCSPSTSSSRSRAGGSSPRSRRGCAA